MSIQPFREQAVQFANRAQDLMDAHPYFDHPTIVALASQPGTDQQARQTATSVASALSSTWDGYEQTWSDPVLATKPSAQASVVRYIKDTIGPPPLDAGSITQLQSALQSDGLGSGLDANGAWTPDWQQQYNQAVEALRSAQLAGNRPGAVPTSKGLSSFLSHMTVTGALDAIGGYLKEAGSGIRSFVGDVEGLIGSEGTFVAGKPSMAKQEFGQQRNTFVNSLGAHETLAQSEARFNGWEALNDLNTVLTFMGVAGLAKKTVIDIAANIDKGLLEEGSADLARRPGVIAKTLFNGSQNGRLLGSKWVGNLPGLARVTPIIGKVAGNADTGYRYFNYYKARTFLAQPYRLPAARAAGQAFSRTQLLGLGLYGDALATSKLPGNEQSQAIYGEHVFDAIDHNIANYGPRLHGFSPLDLNNLAFFLHGPIGAGTKGSASSTVGQASDSFVNAFSDMLGEKGVPAAFQQATGMSRDDWLQAAAGDEKFLSAFMTSKVVGYAKDWWADRQLGEQLTGSAKQQAAQLTQYKRDFNQMSKVDKAKVVSDMLASDPSMTYLTTRIRGDIARGAADPKAAARNSLAVFKQQTEKFQAIQQADGLRYLMSPKGQALLGEEDAAHAAVNRRPDFGSAAHMGELDPNLEQDLGLMRLDNLTRNDVLDPGKIADTFEHALQQAGDDPAARKAVADQMAQHLFENHNWDQRRLGLFGDTDNPEALLAAVRSEAEDLAAEVIPTWDMPDRIRSMIADLRRGTAKDGEPDNGYRIVVGDHLGDFYTGNLPDIGANDGWLTLRRKWAGKAGIDPARVPDKEVGRATRQGIIDELTPLMNELRDKGMLGGPYQTAQTLMAMLREDGGVAKTLPRYLAGVFHALAHFGSNKTEIEQLFKNGPYQSLEEARAQMEARMANGLGPRDTSRKAIINALLNTHQVQTDGGNQWTWHGLIGGDLTDEELANATPEVRAAHKQAVATANRIYRAIQNGYRQPGYIMGWQAIENWARAGFGFGDKLATRYPGTNLLQAVANWPNRVAQVRNRLRFTASFTYDFRRWAKQSAKMAVEGVEPVANPLQRLIDEGADVTAKNLLFKIGGKNPELNDQMDVDRMLAGRSIFGIYNPMWHAAYFVNELAKQGKSEEFIKDAYNRTFKYGAKGATSPLERSVNTVFFPFSFEKTLLRNFGGYLLDRPAQALVLDLAVDEWRKADKNGQIGQWLDDHFPILWEIKELNAFAHGISPGELGGINAPIIKGVAGVVSHATKAVTAPPTGPQDGRKSLALLNLFLPQDWGANLTAKSLSRYLPVFNQFANLWSDSVQQTQIATNALYDVVNHTTNKIQIRPTLTTTAQQQYGTREKVKLADQLQKVLDFNGQQSDDASKIKWVPSDQIPQQIWNQPITKTTIGEYVQAMYPAYDPAKSTAYAQAQQRAEANFISQVEAKDPAKGQQMYEFAHGVNSVIGKIHRDEYTPAQLAQVQSAFRDVARTGARTDPDWKHLWDSFFAYALGPIESPDGKVAA